MVDNKSCASEHDFVLVLTASNTLTTETENALFEAGCDDATLSLRFGRLFLSFSRTAASLKEAILSAIKNVQQANIGADVLRVDVCTLVTQADIARRIGRTRQLIHQYITGTRGPGGFPSPACAITDEAPLWYWCEVAYWLWQNDMIKEEVLREAQEVDAINLALDLRSHQRADPVLINEVLREIGTLPLPGQTGE